MLPSEHYRQPGTGDVLGILHEISARFGYLPEDEIRKAAAQLGVPLSQMLSAATFYAAFSFQPAGRHKIHVCEGTACYVNGSGDLLAELEDMLGVAPDETTADQDFTLKRVRCTGSCGLAPVVRVDRDTFGRLTPRSLEQVLARYRKA